MLELQNGTTVGGHVDYIRERAPAPYKTLIEMQRSEIHSVQALERLSCRLATCSCSIGY